MTRKATPDLLSDGLRANVADTSLDVMFGPPADGERIVQHQTSLWFEALALQDRIQQSYELSPTL